MARPAFLKMTMKLSSRRIRISLPSFLAVLLLFFSFICFCEGLSSVVQQPNVKLLARQIRACHDNIECAMSLLQEGTNDNKELSTIAATSLEALVAAMEVCGKARRYDLALELYNSTKRNKEPLERCRTMAISVCGRCGVPEFGLRLLQDSPPPQAGSWNAAIAACGGVYWKEALDILQERMPASMISTLTCNAVLTCLEKAKQPRHALELLNKMMMHSSSKSNTRFPSPDRVSFHRTLSALIRSEMLDEAYNIVKNMEEDSAFVNPNHETYYMVSNAYAKRGDYDMATKVDQTTGLNNNLVFRHWEDGPNLVKVGQGKTAYWQVGHYASRNVNITIGFQTNRNPSKNGIKMLFFDNHDGTQDRNNKIGYLLMTNNAISTKNGTSALMGMFLSPKERQQGLSKVVLAIWVRWCLEANIEPVSGLIHKPLLALVLQHGLGFVPTGKKGTDVELCPCNTGTAVALYSPVAKSLQGAFSPWDIKSQNLVFTHTPPVPRGRRIRVGSRFAAMPNRTQLNQRAQDILAGTCGTGRLQYKVTHTELRRIFLGV